MQLFGWLEGSGAARAKARALRMHLRRSWPAMIGEVLTRTCTGSAGETERGGMVGMGQLTIVTARGFKSFFRIVLYSLRASPVQ